MWKDVDGLNMFDGYNRCNVHNWDTALAWLSGGVNRKKPHTVGSSRSLYAHGGRLRLHRPNADTIELVFYGATVARYKSNGVTILSRYPYRSTPSQSWRGIINNYTYAYSVVRKGRTIISTHADGRSPSKIRKCRKCRGVGLVDGWCSGPQECRDSNCDRYVQRMQLQKAIGTGQTVDWQAMSKLYHTTVEHGILCSHGIDTHHMVKRMRPCYKCSGTKQYDYGNRALGRVWDAMFEDIAFDANGNYVKIQEV